MDNPITSFFAGATYPLRAAHFLTKNPSLLGYVAMPIGVNVIVGVALYLSLLLPGLRTIDQWAIAFSGRLAQWVAALPAWLAFLGGLGAGLGWILQGLLILLLLVAIGFLLVQFGTLLGAPWYGKLSEKLETLRTGQLENIEVGIVRDIGRALLFELKKLCLALGLGIGLTPLGIVPGLSAIVATSGGVAIASLLVCLDFLDPALERRRLRFRQKLGLILRSFPASTSFGLVCLTLVSIPLLNLVMVPLCITAGTLFFCDRLRPRLLASQSLEPTSLPKPENQS